MIVARFTFFTDAVIKSPKFSALGMIALARLLQEALVFVVF